MFLSTVIVLTPLTDELRRSSVVGDATSSLYPILPPSYKRQKSEITYIGLKSLWPLKASQTPWANLEQITR